MRIQHNIMALNAYRNYTTNASALQKNLERLSSGYKINRAGDDAAGLAISEKMRAQITGLQVAQKNAKDGISLVQTAEGALTEVHDMLNRMVELATQSANGTYSSDTDRVQLQKEMDQLRAEIDRIADSANFNGIQLLDGNMDAGGDVVYTKGAFVFEALHPAGTGSFPLLPPLAKDGVEPARGTDTILHTEGTKGGDKNMFSVDFENLELNKDGKIDITLGNNLTITVENKTGDAVSADDIVSAIAKGGTADAGGTSGISVVFKKGDTVLTPGVAEDGVTKTLTLGETVFEMSANGSRLTFKQTSDDKGIDMPQNVTIANSGDQYVWGDPVDDADGTAFGTTISVTANGALASTALTNATDATTVEGLGTANATLDVTVGGVSFSIKLVKGGATEDTDLDVTGMTGDKLKAALEAKIQELYNSKLAAPEAAGETNTDAMGTVTITLNATGDILDTGASVAAKKATLTSEKVKDCFSGDWNVGTTDIETKFEGTQDRLASTVLTLREDMYAEGSTITIGRDTYTFTTDKTKLGKDGYVVYNKGEDAAAIAVKLTEAAKNNGTYTVGHDKDGRITLLEKEGQTNFDLTTMAGIEKSLGFKTAAARGTDTSKGLTLQIGDTAQSYNQLKVNIKDCHTKALGLDTVSIANQADAGGAVDLINEAINYISDVRGTLGATQNRLDHTINNLSVMTENIQDAESTIRDTDIAEEMMAYTKNNILIQAAQAMLAQANQVPQGVLQLLQ